MLDKPIVGKNELWILLGAKAMDFAAFLNDEVDADSKNVRVMWDSITTVDLSSALFQQVLALLLSKGVITQTEIDTIDAKIIDLTTPLKYS